MMKRGIRIAGALIAVLLLCSAAGTAETVSHLYWYVDSSWNTRIAPNAPVQAQNTSDGSRWEYYSWSDCLFLGGYVKSFKINHGPTNNPSSLTQIMLEEDQYMLAGDVGEGFVVYCDAADEHGNTVLFWIHEDGEKTVYGEYPMEKPAIPVGYRAGYVYYLKWEGEDENHDSVAVLMRMNAQGETDVYDYSQKIHKGRYKATFYPILIDSDGTVFWHDNVRFSSCLPNAQAQTVYMYQTYTLPEDIYIIDYSAFAWYDDHSFLMCGKARRTDDSGPADLPREYLLRFDYSAGIFTKIAEFQDYYPGPCIAYDPDTRFFAYCAKEAEYYSEEYDRGLPLIWNIQMVRGGYLSPEEEGVQVMQTFEIYTANNRLMAGSFPQFLPYSEMLTERSGLCVN